MPSSLRRSPRIVSVLFSTVRSMSSRLSPGASALRTISCESVSGTSCELAHDVPGLVRRHVGNTLALVKHVSLAHDAKIIVPKDRARFLPPQGGATKSLSRGDFFRLKAEATKPLSRGFRL